HQPEMGAHAGQRRACSVRCETLPHRERCLAEHPRGRLGHSQGRGLWITQPSGPETQAKAEKITKSLLLITSSESVLPDQPGAPGTGHGDSSLALRAGRAGVRLLLLLRRQLQTAVPGDELQDGLGRRVVVADGILDDADVIAVLDLEEARLALALL